MQKSPNPLKPMNAFKDYWETYRQQVLPPNMTDTQSLGIQLSFIAGACTVLEFIIRYFDPALSESEGMEIFMKLQHEVNEMLSDIKKTGGSLK